MTGMNYRNENGQTLPLICLFMFSLIGMCALVLDLGGAFVAKRNTQNAADAAALAGVSQLNGNWSGTATSNFAKNTLHINGATVQVALATDFSANDSVQATVTYDQPTYFAKLFGYDSIHVVSTARATAQSIHAENGVVLPFALYSACQPVVGSSVILYGKGATCGSTPSNVGTIQLPAANQGEPLTCNAKGQPNYTAVGNGANDIRDIIDTVLQTGSVQIGDCLANTKTGGSPNPGNALTNGVNDQQMPFPALIPIVQQDAQSGQQGVFTVVAFEWVMVTGVQNGGKEIDGTILGVNDSATNVTTGSYIPGYLNLLGLTQ